MHKIHTYSYEPTKKTQIKPWLNVGQMEMDYKLFSPPSQNTTGRRGGVDSTYSTMKRLKTRGGVWSHGAQSRNQALVKAQSFIFLKSLVFAQALKDSGKSLPTQPAEAAAAMRPIWKCFLLPSTPTIPWSPDLPGTGGLGLHSSPEAPHHKCRSWNYRKALLAQQNFLK